MEKLTSHLFNVDFEASLREEKFVPPSWQTINGELEYLYFWLNNTVIPLHTKKSYQQDFLDYVTSHTGHEATYTDNTDDVVSWWGSLNTAGEWEKEKRLNSKVESCLIRKDLGLEVFPSFVCYNRDELNGAQSSIDGEYVIKEEFNFSGKGLSFQAEKYGDKFPCVVEKWVKRVRDFSVFISDGDFFVSQSQIGTKGAFKGSHHKSVFSEKEVIYSSAHQIWKHYKSKFDCDFIQIDMFQFLDGHDLVINTLSEINHRMTLGRIFNHLQRSFGSHFSFMGLIPTKFLKNTASFQEGLSSYQKYHYNPVTKVGVISLSPGKEKYSLFFFSEESERSLQFLIRDWWKLAVSSAYKLPAEFIIYL